VKDKLFHLDVARLQLQSEFINDLFCLQEKHSAPAGHLPYKGTKENPIFLPHIEPDDLDQFLLWYNKV